MLTIIHRIPLTIICALATIVANAQLSRLTDTLLVASEASATVGTGDNTPYWLTNNRYGLSTPNKNSFLWRASISRDIHNDADRLWQTGYGLELATVLCKDSRAVVQQAFLDVQYKHVRLSVGQKERPSEMLNPLLSSGGLATGINARPIPQLRVEVPDFWVIPGTNDWLALKGHIAYGAYTDNDWQRDFTSNTKNIYSKNSLYHSKAGYLRVGNKYEFPLTLTAGLEMNTQFAGTAYNVKKRADDHTGFTSGTVHMPADIKAFWNALTISGSDATDAGYDNSSGNTVGAWHFSLDIHGIDWAGDEFWKVRFYAEHLFEDHSQLFVQYGWKDWLLGTEINLPQNRFVSDIVYEYLTLKQQSGPIYHDKTQIIPDQISALDNYYNHGVYGAWQHAGISLGNGLLISPIYNGDGLIGFKHNRIQAHHIGIKGQPMDELAYRLLFSYEKSWGTYFKPLTDPQHSWTVLIEGKYSPQWLRNCTLGLAYGHNSGRLMGNADGVQMSIRWNRAFFKKPTTTHSKPSINYRKYY